MEPWQFGPDDNNHKTGDWPPSFPSTSEFEIELKEACDKCPEFETWIFSLDRDSRDNYRSHVMFQTPFDTNNGELGIYRDPADVVSKLKTKFMEFKSMQVFSSQMTSFLAKAKLNKIMTDPKFVEVKQRYEEEIKMYNAKVEFRKQAGVTRTRDLLMPAKPTVLQVVEELESRN